MHKRFRPAAARHADEICEEVAENVVIEEPKKQPIKRKVLKESYSKLTAATRRLSSNLRG